jgi:hypothetical protein
LIVAVRQIPLVVKDMISMKVCFSSRSSVTQSTLVSVPRCIYLSYNGTVIVAVTARESTDLVWTTAAV